MAFRFRFKSTFQKTFNTLSPNNQSLTLKAIEVLDGYFKNQEAPFGLRIKKLHKKTFEARISLSLRIIWVQTKDEIIFSLVGNHEDVRRFIRSL